MAVDIGFVLLTHTNVEQITRLINRLNKMFNHPPIVCHHDFAKCDLPICQFPNNVSFVLPPLPTGWGIFSTVEAAVRAIKMMYEKPAAPGWFVLISGSDYPIKSSERIRHDLEVCPYDANIHYELIDPSYTESDWHRLYCKRYCRKIVLRVRSRAISLPPRLSRPFLPFSESFLCYGGEFWFCANRRAAEYILEFHSARPALASHYRSVPNPEESYFQCILVNAPHLKVSANPVSHHDLTPPVGCLRANYRYMDWSEGGSHPKILTTDDLPFLLSSPAHFARKFDIGLDHKVLDELDAATEQPAR